MPAEGVPGFLNYRVVNRLTGAEVIHNLPHLHTSTWRVNAMQQGAPGSAAVGTFRIPLYPPQTDDHRAAKAFYDQLDYGLRVEGYLGPVGGGAPRYGGIITGIKKGFNAYELTGYSDVWLAQASKVMPGVQITGRSDYVIQNFLGIETQQWGDNFNPYTAGNYTSTGAGNWASATDEGISVLSCSAGGAATYLIATAETATGLSPQQTFEMVGKVVAASTDATNAGQAGLAITTGSVGNTYVYATMRWQAGPANYNVDVSVNRNGVVSTATSVMTGITLPWRFQIGAIADINGSLGKVYLNGKDCGTGVGTGSGLGTTNKIGFFYGVPATGGATFYYTQLYHGYANTDAFGTTGPFIKGTGLWGSGAFSVPYNFPSSTGQSYLDQWSYAAALEGVYWRYTPQALSASAPYKVGTVDFAASPGVDRSASIRFVEGDNLIDASIEANAEFFATVARVQGIPGADSGGFAQWRNLTASSTYGVLQDNVPMLQNADWTTLRRFGQSIVANKTALNNAKVITVLRDPATADVWRELDYITVHSPTLGQNNVRSLILAYDFTEGAGHQQLWLDQYAIGAYELAARRFGSSVAYIANTFGTR